MTDTVLVLVFDAGSILGGFIGGSLVYIYVRAMSVLVHSINRPSYNPESRRDTSTFGAGDRP